MNPNIPKAQLDEERKKRRAGRHHKTDCTRRRGSDPLYGFGPLVDKAFMIWEKKRGFTPSLGHRDQMNRDAFKRAQAANRMHQP